MRSGGGGGGGGGGKVKDDGEDEFHGASWMEEEPDCASGVLLVYLDDNLVC